MTGVNVRSNPATAVVACRECRAMNEDSSRGSFGARPYSWAEHVPAYVGADLRPFDGGQRPVLRHPQRSVRLGTTLGDLDPERRRGVHHYERLPEPDPLPGVRLLPGPAGLLVHHLPGDRVGVRVLAFGEQGRHLVCGHVLAGVQVDVGQGGAEPPAGGLPALAVVVRQPGVPAVGGIHRGDLPGQVRVPVPGGQLVERHHSPVSTEPRSGWTRSRQLFSSNLCSTPEP